MRVKFFSLNKGANSTFIFELIDHSTTFVDDLNHKMFCLIIILALTKEIQLLHKHYTQLSLCIREEKHLLTFKGLLSIFMWSDVYLFWNDLKKNSKSVTVTYLYCMSLVSWISVKSINPLPSLFFAFSFGKNKNSSKNIGRIDLFRVPVNKGTNPRLGWTNYSDLYEIVHPNLVLISFCLFT